MILLTDVSDYLGKTILSRLQSSGQWEKIRVIVPPEKNFHIEKYDKIEYVAGRLNDHPFLDKALKDIDTLILNTSNILYDYRALFKALISAAKGNRINHLIYISSVLAEDLSDTRAHECHETELYIYQSGIPYTILRINILMEQLPFFIGNPYENEKIYYPGGNGKINFISSVDVSEVIFHILNNKTSKNKIYVLSHENGYTFYDIASKLSQIKRKNIFYEDIDPHIYEEALSQTFLSVDSVNRLCNIARSIKQNKFNISDYTLQQILISQVNDKKNIAQNIKEWFFCKENKPLLLKYSIKNLPDFLSETEWNKVYTLF